ncbi:hypothetical protein [Gracilibacillus kekensis]|uniref:Uncharacterized protein n=1 Tax=Gracilibacillus kekensis TaxID=1027249 RepID=A0A1M7QQH3_9BACI|nr:hypothetical protein [Gracilibacillus kekensis]SHN33767.1 hypothetical protein SAMN05216179_3466 [Gracilibacillus kekensis]
MDIMGAFNRYINTFHPEVKLKNWLVDAEILDQSDAVNRGLHRMIPKNAKKIRCFTFFYIGGEKKVIYFMQDASQTGGASIGLMKDDALVHFVRIKA